VTGNLQAKKALVDVYDIFGPAPQTLQGADALAKALDILVVVPDFFRGSPAQSEVSFPFLLKPKTSSPKISWREKRERRIQQG
jgi:hypothetical protein